jgi:hypothetical protein
MADEEREKAEKLAAAKKRVSSISSTAYDLFGLTRA